MFRALVEFAWGIGCRKPAERRRPRKRVRFVMRTVHVPFLFGSKQVLLHLFLTTDVDRENYNEDR